MTNLDKISMAICAWKEARNGGAASMQAVMNVILNRAKVNRTSVYDQIYRPLQFSSMTYQHDPQLLKQPDDEDPQYIIAQELAKRAAEGTLEDITNGALFYYALSIPEPIWAKQMTQTVVIGGQRFLK